MHQGYNDLETIIEDEFLDDHFEHERIPHDNYGIEFNDRYLVDPIKFELDEAVKRIQDDNVEPNLEKHSIIELMPEWEIQEITIEKPIILRYLNPK